MKVIDRINKLIDDRGLTQKKLEEMAELPKGRISLWRKGTGVPKISHMVRIARVLEVPLEWLADDDAPEEPPAQAQEIKEPPAAILVDDELAVLYLYRALRLTRDEALRRLAREGDKRNQDGGVRSTNPEFPSGVPRINNSEPEKHSKQKSGG